VKFVSGVSESASSYQKKQHKKYGGNIGFVRRNINFDIRHGVTREEVIEFLDRIRTDSSYAHIRKSVGSKERLEQLQV
jgi:hypothetical protein